MGEAFQKKSDRMGLARSGGSGNQAMRKALVLFELQAFFGEVGAFRRVDFPT
jgi:hypothetical protein